MKHLGDVPLYPRSHYARVITPELPRSAFAPARSRALLVPVWLAVIVSAMYGVVVLPWFVAPALSIVIGVAFAGLTFIGHEALHGAIVRGRRRQHLIGLIGFLPFCVSPTLWTAWHNRAHHAHTNLEDDPDAYPSLARYHVEAGSRFAVNAFSLGGRRWRGALSLILGFTVQSTHQLITAHGRGILTRAQQWFALGETLFGVLLWTTLGIIAGGVAFIFMFAIPLLLANACVMAFILTNHSLSPRVEENDPLVSGLSVTVPAWIDRLTLGFGYHVEHHVLPAVSTRHAPAVRALLRQHWPTRYQSMSLADALLALHRTGRVYKDAVTLCDPLSGGEFPTLLPGATRPPGASASGLLPIVVVPAAGG